ncbi:SH3 domain-containing protein [Umezawaea sp. Da 62-37]|uniref:SH3 domain-containing protein n=1 Tax=Umezawaea sp. Da 62-37 TaxID=3075927 RepID=UPI0028F73CAA|nr:SH3 domain-containing protein [Umezawaea sp. Da 62-37]WNV89140.1 SH3 domain-containing protein [Umezawaea sp. Da 62-37]
MKSIHKSVAAAFGVAVVATGSLVLGAATAFAAPPGEVGVTAQSTCPDNDWSNKDNRTGKFVLTAANIRTGPSTTCTSVGQAQTSHSVTLHCWKYGAGGTWSHVRDNTTGRQGWIKDSLLVNSGAANKC